VVTTTAAAPPRGTEARVNQRIDELLAAHDPARTPDEEFWGAQFDAGLAWVANPSGKGGLGVEPGLQDLVDQRLGDAGVATNLFRNMMGVGMAGPTLAALGTEEQQERLLRPAFTCEEIWCQMFSEPGAGSDVASLSTRAERDGDEWVVNGQKVWTTVAHVAKWGLLLTRTDPRVPKHRGLTYFYIDMHQPGVDVRPLRQMTGDAEFNEIFFNDARIPDAQRIGEVGRGWDVAITTLMNERALLGRLGKLAKNSAIVRHPMRIWRARPDSERDPVRRDALARLFIESEIVRYTTLRADAQRERGTPGPEGTLGRLLVSEHQQRVTNFCVDLLGPEGMLVSGYEMTRPTVVGEQTVGDDDKFDVQKAFLNSRGGTIGGGTSEIGRNIIGERVLGLPKEPDPYRETPWSDLPRN
jgi:alkylation response protein AidB-like acyl-CoA dehydrogenase